MEMKPVESSLITAIGYDEATETLRIEFKSGGAYEYANVPKHVHEDMLASESVGKFFLRRIKGNPEYLFTKV